LVQKFYCPHALAGGNQRIRIREKTLDFMHSEKISILVNIRRSTYDQTFGKMKTRQAVMPSLADVTVEDYYFKPTNTKPQAGKLG